MESQSSAATAGPKRVTPDSDRGPYVRTSPSPAKRPRLQPPSAIPSRASLLYHVAISAHLAAHTHLQHVFIPSFVAPVSTNCPSLYTTAANGTRHHFLVDPAATDKALGLLLVSLDCLHAGIKLPDLDYAERVEFGVAYGLVGLEVLRTIYCDTAGQTTRRMPLNHKRLRADLQDVISSSLALAQQSVHFERQTQVLRALGARLAYAQGMHNLARRMARNLIRDVPRENSEDRCKLYLLLAEFTEDPTARLGVMDELLAETRSPDIFTILLVNRLATLFQTRSWDAIPSTLRRLEHALTEGPGQSGLEAVVRTQYTLLSCLWASRSGDDAEVKRLLKIAYTLLDEGLEADSFKQLRRRGGTVLVDNGTLIRVTPPNVLFMLTYLTTVVCKRDFIGTERSCKTLVYAAAMRQYAHTARRDDIWDIGCGFPSLTWLMTVDVGHTIADALQMRRQVQLIRAEVMMEAILARIYRTEMDEAERIFGELLVIKQTEKLDELVPQMLFLKAQRDHLLGRTDSAHRLYLACKTTLVPGSELGLLLNISLLGVNGELVDPSSEPSRAAIVADLVAQCKGTSNASIRAVGLFLASLSDPNIASAKHKITLAYEVVSKANNNVLRCLIFAFTTSTHLTGTQDKILKQLQTGKEIAWLMGGKDRQDAVGQIALGLWFAVKLKGWYRMLGDDAALDRARASAQAHKVRSEHMKSILP